MKCFRDKLIWMALVIVVPTAGLLAEELPPVGKLTYEITPGKPGAPTERIEVAWSDEASNVRLIRQQDDKVLEMETHAIPRSAAAQTWKLVQRFKLIEFKPKSTKRAFDFGLHRFQIQWQEDDETKRAAVSWTQPLDNGAGPDKLAKALSSLAAKHAKKWKSFYFPK